MFDYTLFTNNVVLGRYLVPLKEVIESLRSLDGQIEYFSVGDAELILTKLRANYVSFLFKGQVRLVKYSGEPDHYPILYSKLTPLGHKALSALENGFVWDLTTQNIDITMTRTFYQRTLMLPTIPVDIIDRMPSCIDEKIKREYLRLKLSGAINDGWIYWKEDEVGKFNMERWYTSVWLFDTRSSAIRY